ncbi:MAG: hypothetical protein Q7R56_02935 [Nanoarchaeota archaeon]|nr:hypothetical protein [Nanoarchaeota archaeon]
MDKGQELRFKALECLRTKGPALPVNIAQAIGRDTFFAGAILSDLIRERKVYYTAAKIGGSSLYYLLGQEAQLEKLYQYLPMREKEAYTFLKNKKILRDTEEAPAIRVALRNLKDFAIPLNVTTGTTEELFWKWYLVEDQEAEKIIRINYLNEPEEVTIPETLPAIKTVENNLLLEEKKPEKKTKIIEEETFLPSIKNYLQQKNIMIIKEEKNRKNSETELLIKLPTAAGIAAYYCIAKNKKKIGLADITVAHNKALMKKLPLFFITTGEITIKTREQINQQYPGIIIGTLQQSL